MLILGLLGMYFDAAVVFVTNSKLFLRLAVAILCYIPLMKSTTLFDLLYIQGFIQYFDICRSHTKPSSFDDLRRHFSQEVKIKTCVKATLMYQINVAARLLV